MIITDAELVHLKPWIVTKLEIMYVFCCRRDQPNPPRNRSSQLTMRRQSSDADSDVLADYVIALVRADDPESQLRPNVVSNLEDFLKDSKRSALSSLIFFPVLTQADRSSAAF